MFQKAPKLVASVPIPSATLYYQKSWHKFVTYAQKMGFDPLEASSEEVVSWLIQRTEETASPVQVQTDLPAPHCWRCPAGKSLGEIPFETSVAKGFHNLRFAAKPTPKSS